MTDLAISWIDGEPDLIFENGDLLVDDSIMPAVLVSLFTDAQALPSDAIPDGTTNRRGFWGDSLDAPGTKTGSRLWLDARAKELPDTLLNAQGYDIEALQWMVDAGIVTAVSAVVTAPVRGTQQHQIGITWPGQTAIDVISVIEPGAQVL